MRDSSFIFWINSSTFIGFKVFPRARPGSQQVLFHFPIPHNHHVRNFLHFRFPDLQSQLFVPEILLRADARFDQLLVDLLARKGSAGR